MTLLKKRELLLEPLAAALREAAKLERGSDGSPEAGWVRTWLDTVLDVPWNVRTDDSYDIPGARAVLDADHAGLDEVKERIIEYLAVRKRLADKGLSVAGGRRSGAVLALAGHLRQPVPSENVGPLQELWRRAIGLLIQRPTEDFAEALPDDVLATGRDINSALQGTPGTRMRRTPDGRAVVLSAAYPIWNGDEVAGAVVVEETTNPIVSLRSAALERLLLLTLAAFAGAGAILIAYATRLSHRIRSLRDEAESAIDARGRIARLSALAAKMGQAAPRPRPWG